VTQSTAAAPLHLLTIEATKDITMCYRLLVAHLVQGILEWWKNEEERPKPKSEPKTSFCKAM
jgi:hypothetical protein